MERLNDYGAFAKAMQEAGVLRMGNNILGHTYTLTVQMKDIDVEVHNQPLSKEEKQLSAFYVLDVNDMEAAAVWAIRCPAAKHGIVEVRPLGSHPVGA